MVSATSARKWSGGRVGVLAVAFSLLAVSVLASAPVSAHRGTTITLTPTGSDDTANLQAALDACRGEDHPCTIRLAAGTFHIAQVIAWDFHGALQGMGRDTTVLEALPLLHVNDAGGPMSTPWFVDPTPAEPWPVLITFLDGNFVMSDLTVRIPGYPVTEPWEYFGFMFQDILAIMVVGGRTYVADAAFDHLNIEGAPGDPADNEYNIFWGIAYEGDGDYRTLDPAKETPLTGSFSVSHSSFRWVTLGAFAYRPDARIVMTENRVDHADTGFVVRELAAGTDVVIAHNSARNVRDSGAFVYQSGVWAEEGPNHVLFARNRFQVIGGCLYCGDLGDGIEVWDLGGVKTVRAEVLDNEITLQAATGVRSGVVNFGARDTIIRGNRVEGPGSFGVAVFGGSGSVRDNHVRGTTTGVLLSGASGVAVRENHIDLSALWGVAVLSDSSGNTIRGNHVKHSGAFDLVWDGTGTANVWSKNHCGTSDPPGLC